MKNLLHILAVLCATLCLTTLSEGAPTRIRDLTRPPPFAPSRNTWMSGGYEAKSQQQAERDLAQLFSNVFTNVIRKRIENGEIQSVDQMFDQMVKVVSGIFSKVLSVAGNRVNPDDQFSQLVLNGFQTIFSAFMKGVDEAKKSMGSNGEEDAIARDSSRPINYSEKVEEQFWPAVVRGALGGAARGALRRLG